MVSFLDEVILMEVADFVGEEERDIVRLQELAEETASYDAGVINAALGFVSLNPCYDNPALPNRCLGFVRDLFTIIGEIARPMSPAQKAKAAKKAANIARADRKNKKLRSSAPAAPDAEKFRELKLQQLKQRFNEICEAENVSQRTRAYYTKRYVKALKNAVQLWELHNINRKLKVAEGHECEKADCKICEAKAYRKAVVDEINQKTAHNNAVKKELISFILRYTITAQKREGRKTAFWEVWLNIKGYKTFDSDYGIWMRDDLGTAQKKKANLKARQYLRNPWEIDLTSETNRFTYLNVEEGAPEREEAIELTPIARKARGASTKRAPKVVKKVEEDFDKIWLEAAKWNAEERAKRDSTLAGKSAKEATEIRAFARKNSRNPAFKAKVEKLRDERIAKKWRAAPSTAAINGLNWNKAKTLSKVNEEIKQMAWLAQEDAREISIQVAKEKRQKAEEARAARFKARAELIAKERAERAAERQAKYEKYLALLDERNKRIEAEKLRRQKKRAAYELRSLRARNRDDYLLGGYRIEEAENIARVKKIQPKGKITLLKELPVNKAPTAQKAVDYSQDIQPWETPVWEKKVCTYKRREEKVAPEDDKVRPLKTTYYWHDHQCKACGVLYTHTHSGGLKDHDQVDFQCPNTKCELYFRRGEGDCYLNKTRSKYSEAYWIRHKPDMATTELELEPGWVRKPTGVEYEVEGKFTYVKHCRRKLVSTDRNDIETNMEFGDVTKKVFLGKKNGPSYDVHWGIDDYVKINGVWRVCGYMPYIQVKACNFVSGTPIWNEVGELCSVITSSYGREIYFLPQPHQVYCDTNVEDPKCVFIMIGDQEMKGPYYREVAERPAVEYLMEKNWSRMSNGVHHRDKKHYTTAKHCLYTLSIGDKNDFHTNEKFGEITPIVHLGTKNGPQLRVEGTGYDYIKVKNGWLKSDDQLPYFVRDEDLISGTPIWNDLGELCSIITGSFDGRRYVLAQPRDEYSPSDAPNPGYFRHSPSGKLIIAATLLCAVGATAAPKPKAEPGDWEMKTVDDNWLELLPDNIRTAVLAGRKANTYLIHRANRMYELSNKIHEKLKFEEKSFNLTKYNATTMSINTAILGISTEFEKLKVLEDRRKNAISMVDSMEKSGVNVVSFREVIDRAHNKTETYHLKLEQQKQVIEGFYSEMLVQLKINEEIRQRLRDAHETLRSNLHILKDIAKRIPAVQRLVVYANQAERLTRDRRDSGLTTLYSLEEENTNGCNSVDLVEKTTKRILKERQQDDEVAKLAYEATISKTFSASCAGATVDCNNQNNHTICQWNGELLITEKAGVIHSRIMDRQFTLKEAECLCDNLEPLFTSAFHFDVVDSSRTIFRRDCMLEGRMASFTTIEKVPPKTVFAKVNLSSLAWLGAALISTIVVTQYKGYITGLLVGLLLVLPVAESLNCSADGRIIEAKNNGKDIFLVNTKWKVDDCVHFGTYTVKIVELGYIQQYMRTFLIAERVGMKLKTKYGCPGGKSYSVCEEDMGPCETPVIASNEYCTSSYNTMWAGTSCAANGQLHIKTKVCTHLASSSMFYSIGNMSTVYYMKFEHEVNGQREIKTVTSEDSDYVGFSNVYAVGINPYRNLISSQGSNYAVVENSVLQKMCFLTTSKELVDENCFKVELVQKGHSVTIKKHPENWRVLRGTPAIPKIESFDEKSLTLTQQVQYLKATLSVEQAITSEMQQACSSLLAGVPSIEAGENGNYKTSKVSLFVGEARCFIELSCKNCYLLGGRKLLSSPAKQIKFELLCGLYSHDQCTLKAGNESTTIKLDDLTRNPTFVLDKTVQEVHTTLNDTTPVNAGKWFFNQLSNAYGSLTSLIGFGLYKVLYYGMVALGIFVSVQLFMNGKFMVSGLVLAASLLPLVSGEPVCARWDSDCNGMQIPKDLCREGKTSIIHGVWNLDPKGKMPCNRTAAELGYREYCNFEVAYPVNEYCKHGAAYGYSPEEYFSQVNEVCHSTTWVPHQCRYNGSINCLEQETTQAIGEIGCEGEHYARCSGAVRLYSTVYLIACVLFICFVESIYSVVAFYPIKDDIFYILLASVRRIQRSADDLFENIRSDYNTVRSRATVVFNIIVLFLIFKFGFTLASLAVVAAYLVQHVKSFTQVSESEIHATEEDYTSFVIDEIAKVWPKVKPTPQEIIYHQGESFLVKMSTVVSAFADKDGDVLNMAFISENGKRAFFAHKFASGGIVAPAHAVYNDISAIKYNDVLIKATSIIEAKELYEVIKHQECIDHKKLPKMRPGDSGKILIGNGSVYMHSGVLRNGAPVCCYCGFESFTQHIDTVEERIKKLARANLDKHRAVVNYSKQSTSTTAKAITTRHGTQVSFLGHTTSKMRDLKLTPVSKEDLAKQQKARVSRTILDYKEQSQTLFPKFFYNKVGETRVYEGKGEVTVEHLLKVLYRDKLDVIREATVVELKARNLPKMAEHNNELADLRELAKALVLVKEIDLKNAQRRKDLAMHKPDVKNTDVVLKKGQLLFVQTPYEYKLKRKDVVKTEKLPTNIEHHSGLDDPEEETINVRDFFAGVFIEIEKNGIEMLDFCQDVLRVWNREKDGTRRKMSGAYTKLENASFSSSSAVFENPDMFYLATKEHYADIFTGEWAWPEMEEEIKPFLEKFTSNRNNNTLVLAEIFDHYTNAGVFENERLNLNEDEESLDLSQESYEVVDTSADAINTPQGQEDILYQEAFRDKLTTIINEKRRLNVNKPKDCPKPDGEDVTNIIGVEHWINHKTITRIYQIDGIKNGHAGSIGGDIRTCYHVGNEGKLVIPYLASNNIDNFEDTGLKVKVQFEPHTMIKTHSGDLNIYRTKHCEKSQWGEIKPGQIYVVFDIRRKRFSTILCETTNMLSGKGLLFHTFVHVDLSLSVDNWKIPCQTKMKGMSGSPILNCRGKPVGVWGTSIVHERTGIEKSICRVKTGIVHDKMANMNKAEEVLQQHREAVHQKKYLRISAATGSGKSTHLPLACALKLHQGNRLIKVVVIVPTKSTCDLLYDYMKVNIANSEYHDKVKITKTHGDAVIDTSFSKARIEINYTVYGSALKRSDRVFSDFDLIFADEIHTRANSQLQAFVALMRKNFIDKIVTLTATCFESDMFIDMVLKGSTPYEITEGEVTTIKEEKDVEKAMTDNIVFINGKEWFAIPKSCFDGKHRTIIFHATKNQCYAQKAFLNAQGVEAISVTSEGFEKLTEGCFLCATEVIESSATIPECDKVIDLMTCNRPKITLDMDDEKIFLHHEFQPTPIDACQQEQRRGRTGRTCSGTYYQINSKMSAFEEFPASSCIDGALEIISADLLDYNVYANKNQFAGNLVLDYVGKLSPAASAMNRVNIEGHGIREWNKRCKERISLARDYSTIPSICWYLMPNLPRVLTKYPDLFCTGKTSNFKELYPREAIPDDDYEDYCESLGISLNGTFFSKLDIRCSEIADYITDVKNYTARVRQHFEIPTKTKMNTNAMDWLSYPVGTVLAAVSIVGYAATELNKAHSGDRVVSKVLNIPVKSQYDEAIWDSLLHYEYNDKEYHLGVVEKRYKLARTIWRKVSHHLRSMSVTVARTVLSQEQLTQFDAWLNIKTYSETDWMATITSWLENVFEKVNSVDLSGIENIGMLAAFPAIGMFFNHCCEEYGEVLTTISACVFSVYSLDKLGTNIFLSASLVTLAVNTVRSLIFQKDSDTSYSSNLAFAIGAVPVSYLLLKKILIGKQDQMVQIIKEVQTLKAQDVKNVAAFNFAGAMISGSGGVDSGYRLGMMIIKCWNSGSIGQGWKQKTETLSTALMMCFKLKDFNAGAWATAATLVGVDFAVRSFTQYLRENKQSTRSAAYKAESIVQHIMERDEGYQESHIDRFEKLYRFIIAAIGHAVSPMSIPFTVYSLAVEWLKGNKENDPVDVEKFLTTMERGAFVSPVVSIITTSLTLYNIVQNAGSWSNPIDVVGNLVGTSGEVITNSDESFFQRVIVALRNACQWVIDKMVRVPIRLVATVVQWIVEKVDWLLTKVRAGCNTVKEGIADYCRETFLSMFHANDLYNWVSSKIKGKEQISLDNVSDEKTLWKLLHKYGLNSISDFIANRMSLETNFNLLSAWMPCADPNNLMYYQFAREQTIQMNSNLMASYLAYREIPAGLLDYYLTGEHVANRISYLLCKSFWSFLLSKKCKDVKSLGIHPSGTNALLNNRVALLLTQSHGDLIVMFHCEEDNHFEVLIVGRTNSGEPGTAYVISNDTDGKMQPCAGLPPKAMSIKYDCLRRQGTKSFAPGAMERIMECDIRKNKVLTELVYCLSSTDIASNMEKILKIATNRTCWQKQLAHDVVAGKRDNHRIVTNILQLLNVEAMYASNSLGHVYIDEMELTLQSKPVFITYTDGQHQDLLLNNLFELSTCQDIEGLRLLYWRVARTFKGSCNLATCLNIATGCTVKVCDDFEQKTLLYQDWSLCSKCYITVRIYSGTVTKFTQNVKSCKLSVMPLVINSEETQLMDLTKNDLKNREDPSKWDFIYRAPGAVCTTVLSGKKFTKAQRKQLSKNILQLSLVESLSEECVVLTAKMAENILQYFMPLEIFANDYVGFDEEYVGTIIHVRVITNIRQKMFFALLNKAASDTDQGWLILDVSTNEFNFIDPLYAQMLKRLEPFRDGFYIVRTTECSWDTSLTEIALLGDILDASRTTECYYHQYITGTTCMWMRPGIEKPKEIRFLERNKVSRDIKPFMLKSENFISCAFLPEANIELCPLVDCYEMVSPKLTLSCLADRNLRQLIVKESEKRALSKRERKVLSNAKENTLTRKIRVMSSKKVADLPVKERVAESVEDKRTFMSKDLVKASSWGSVKNLLKIHREGALRKIKTQIKTIQGIDLGKNKVCISEKEIIDIDNVSDESSLDEPVASTSGLQRTNSNSSASEDGFEDSVINTNSKKSLFARLLFGEKKELISLKEQETAVRQLQLKNAVMADNFAQQHLTRQAATAIWELSSKSLPSAVETSIVHFDCVSERRLKNPFDRNLAVNIDVIPVRPNSIPQGLPIEPLTRDKVLPEIPRVDWHHTQRLMQNLDGICTGNVWEVMKRWNRAYLPKNNELSTVSRGYMKAALMDADLGLFSGAHNVIDLSAGAGGFIQYWASLEHNNKPRRYLWTTLTRPSHVNTQLDAIEASISRVRSTKTVLEKFSDPDNNGDFRYKKNLENAKQYCKIQGIDLLVVDCGESNSLLEVESNWMVSNLPIQALKKQPTLSLKPAEAIKEYIQLLRQGGAAVIKLMGFRAGTLKTLRLWTPYFTKMVAYKTPTSSYQSREWYVVLIGKRDKPVSETFSKLEQWLNAIEGIWTQNFIKYYNWVKSQTKIFVADLKKNGPEGFGLGLNSKGLTIEQIVKQDKAKGAHHHYCFACGRVFIHYHQGEPGHRQQRGECPYKDCLQHWRKFGKPDSFSAKPVDLASFQRQTARPRPVVPCYSMQWKNPNGVWVKLGPEEIVSYIEKHSVRTPVYKLPFPEKVTILGEDFYPQMDARKTQIEALIKENGYHILPPSGFFKKIPELGRVSFKNRPGKEKHTANPIIADLMFKTFGLTSSTSVIGHTQCTEEFLESAWRKRLDIWPSEPNEADAHQLLAAMKANQTPEYREIASGPEAKKFRFLTFEEACKLINNQGKGGHFDKWQNFKEAVEDPAFKKAVLKRMDDLEKGMPVASYQTCRDKRETKAKKCIDANGQLVLPAGTSYHDSAYKKLNAFDKKARREARKEFLKQSANISPRNIRYTEFVQRMCDLMILGSYQQYHNNIAKMYMGSTTGTALWKLGDLTRAIYEVYANDEQKEFILGDKVIDSNRGKFSKEFLKEYDRRNVKIDLYSDAHSKNVFNRIVKAKRSLIASGDFSGWDGTVTCTDHCIEYLHLKGVYRSECHRVLKNRLTLYMFSFTITDNGNILMGWGQRSSGDQATSSGNTLINDNLHVASTAVSQGKTCAEVCKIIGVVHYRADFDEKPKWKKYYLREVSHIADGDDNNHFGTEDHIQGINVTGVRFLERCGKSIRCGTRSGYDIGTKFTDLSYCSHRFTRVRQQVNDSCRYTADIDQLLVNSKEKPKRVEDPVDPDDKNVKLTYDLVEKTLGSLKGSWSLVHQRVYDSLNDLVVRYLPIRPLSEIMGKLTYTIKSSVIHLSVNRVYGTSSKEKLAAVKNEHAIEITRGKALAYLLNYVHIETVRKVVAAILATIGDGTCDLVELKRRGLNVPSTTGSCHSAIKSVFNIQRLTQIECLPRSFDRHGLNIIRRNSLEVFERGCYEDESGFSHRIAPVDVVNLEDSLVMWVDQFCDRNQIRPDSFWREQIRKGLYSEPQKKPRQGKTQVVPVKKSKLVQLWMSLFLLDKFRFISSTGMSEEPKKHLIVSNLDLADIRLVDNKVPGILARVIKEQKFSPNPGDELRCRIDSKEFRICFVRPKGDAGNYDIVNNFLRKSSDGDTSVIVNTPAFSSLSLRGIKLRRTRVCGLTAIG